MSENSECNIMLFCASQILVMKITIHLKSLSFGCHNGNSQKSSSMKQQCWENFHFVEMNSCIFPRTCKKRF